MSTILNVSLGLNGMRFICLIEQHSYSEEQLQGIQLDDFIKTGLCRRVKTEISFRITGFVVCENTLVVVFPKGYKLPTEETIFEHIRALAGTLLRYRFEENLLPEEDEYLFGANAGSRYGIGPALWLINDYLKHGLLRREIKTRKVGFGGNIDWARTVRTVTPYVIDKRPVYLDHVVRMKNSDSDNYLVLLHKYAVQESIRRFGWIMGTGLDFQATPVQVPFDDNVMDNLLKQQQFNTFVEREIKLIQMIRHFLLGSARDSEVTSLDTLATPYFYFVWEKICGTLFVNDYINLKDLVPTPVWKWRNRAKPKTMRQIPDILYYYQEMLYILDAKYYNTENDLPGWTDLVKQFFYAYSMKEDCQLYVNVLIFPSTHENIFEYKGYANVEGREDLGKVEAVSLDVFFAMRHYAYYSHENLRCDLKTILPE